MKIRIRPLLRAAALAGAMASTTVVGATPVSAFSSSSSVAVAGVTYRASADSCNLYWSACSWSTKATASKTKTFTHRSEVKANGLSVTVTISKVPKATISGNSTSLASAVRTTTAKTSEMNGTAKPSKLSVSVAARSRLTSGSVSLNSGWTTW